MLVSLAAAPSPARLDRLLAVAWDSGAQPVVVLTKADLSRTAESERDEVAEAALAAPVLLTSTVDGRGLAELRGQLRPGRTAVLLGVSGAGKSSLLNALAGAEVARVGAVGAAGKGRHTTTARELTVLPGWRATPRAARRPALGDRRRRRSGLRDVVELAGGAGSGTAGTPASRTARWPPRWRPASCRPPGGRARPAGARGGLAAGPVRRAAAGRAAPPVEGAGPAVRSGRPGTAGPADHGEGGDRPPPVWVTARGDQQPDGVVARS